MSSSTEAVQDDLCLLRAEGVIYSIEVESGLDSLDWLDHALLDLTDESQRIDELFRVIPIPQRFLEDAIARLLEGNRLLLDVDDGCVRASHLESMPVGRQPIPLEIWQDHATGMILPAEQVKPWAEGGSRLDNSEPASTQRLHGGPPRRTPLEMSEAELLHRLQRFRPEVERTAVVRSRERVKRLALEVRAQRRHDGRLAIKDSIPWPLRAAWARLSDLVSGGEEDLLRRSLPTRWEEAVGRWFQESYDRIRSSKEPRGALGMLLRLLESDAMVEVGASGGVITKRLAREAQSSIILAISDGWGTPGDAVQILQESSARERILVLSGVGVSREKCQEWEQQGIRLVSTGIPQGPDFLLADGRVLAFGGIARPAARVFTIRSRTQIEAYVAWLAGIGVLVSSEEVSADDLTRDLKAFDNEIRDFVEHRGRRQGDEGLEVERELEAVLEHLKGRCRQLELRLLERNSTPMSWIPPAEVLALVEQWTGSLRVLVRDGASPLAKAASSRKVECAAWREADSPVDCVVTDRVVLLGFSLMDEFFSGPDFLAIYDGDLASHIRMETFELLRIVE